MQTEGASETAPTMTPRPSALLRPIFLLFPLLVLVVASAVDLRADDTGSGVPEFSRRHQAGARVGAWINQGDTPPSQLNDSYLEFRSEIANANIYGEIFANFRLLPYLTFEFSLGAVNRGTISIRDTVTGDESTGNLLINPALASIHLYPLGTTSSRIQPWFGGGGGIYMARRSVQFINYGGGQFGRYYGDFTDETQTKFSYIVAGGFDWVLGNTIALEASGRWQPLTLGSGLALTESYDALVVTAGIKYLFLTNKKK